MLLPAHCHGFLSHFTSRAPSPNTANRMARRGLVRRWPYFHGLNSWSESVVVELGGVDNVSALKPSFSADNLQTQRCKTKMVNLEGCFFFFLRMG